MNKRYWELPKVSYDEVVRLFTVPKTKAQIYKDRIAFMGMMSAISNNDECNFLLHGIR